MKRLSIFFLFLLTLNAWAVTPEELEEHKKYAEEGIVAAQYNLGTIYANGKGVPQDYAEAIKWYRKAAAQGDIESQKSLAAINRMGWGVEKKQTKTSFRAF